MKKIIFLVVVLIAGLAVGYALSSRQENILGGGEAPVNSMGYLTASATSTGSYAFNFPVLLLDRDPDRRYAVIQNNSDTDVYLYFLTTALDMTGTGAANNASTTITTLNGIRLAPNDSDNLDDTFVIDNSNRIYGYVYASSTATAKEILVNYY